jgi:eukaryotic-like serine/threonine-protein kinase
MLLQGTRLGPYKIISKIGAGGMGEVYRAHDVRLDRDVAIKILAERLVNDPEAIVRFEREAKAVASLSHPNILAIHDFDQDKDVYFTATELLEGETLRQRISKSALPWRKAVEIGIAITEGLAAAHSKGVIHRDLKPENIFLTSDGQVKILDFGLAAIRSQKKVVESSALTESGETEETVLGTVGYMSPEQIRSSDVDGRSDLFSCGCILYEMLTGQRAFRRETVFETVAAVLKEDPPELAETGMRIPPELQRLVHHCLEKNEKERAQSAHDVAFELRTILNTRGTSAYSFGVAESQTRLPLWISATLILVVLGFLLYLVFGRRESIRSIAILPFHNASANPNSEYLSDGITESIINDLAQISGLRVMARSTVFRYKGRDIDPEKIGRDLKVDAVLTGILVQRENDLVIKTELVKVADGSQLWGENYHPSFADMLPLQEEISRKIVEKLRLRLSRDQQQRFTKSHQPNTEAYHLYLKGRYNWNKRTPDGLKTGIEYFKQAIEKDPTYALAYAGLADSYALLGNYGVIPQDEALQRAQGAATKALEIDEALPEAHTSLAYVYFHNWQWSNAENEFKRAIELKPGYSTAHHWYANLLQITDRQTEGISEMKTAENLDPLSVMINVTLGVHLYAARQYDPAIEQLQKTLELQPNFVFTHSSLGQAYGQKGIRDKAIEELETAVKLSDGAADCQADLAYLYAISGKQNDAKAILDNLKTAPKEEYVSPVYIALVYAGLRNHDQAMQWLQKGYAEHSEALTFIKVEPRFDSLRQDARFQQLLRQMGL